MRCPRVPQRKGFGPLVSARLNLGHSALILCKMPASVIHSRNIRFSIPGSPQRRCCRSRDCSTGFETPRSASC